MFLATRGFLGALSVASLALTACSGGGSSAANPLAALNQQQVPAQMLHRHGWLSPQARRQKLVYVSDNTANAIVIYPQGENDPGPIGEITLGIDGPYGSFVDKSGKLYVANDAAGTVTEYPRGTTSPSVTLAGLTDPDNVTVDGHGNVYVTENSSGSLVEFAKGHTTPTRTITGLTHAEGVTNDTAGDVYVAWTVKFDNAFVSECLPHATACTETGITMELAEDVKIDADGNLVVCDGLAEVINIYPPGSTTPSRTIDVSGHQPYRLALDAKDRTLYMADPANFDVVLYDYASGAQTGTITLGLENAVGVSLDPHQPTGP
jgi:sugar lactone lactonase YvrE